MDLAEAVSLTWSLVPTLPAEVFLDAWVVLMAIPR
jgi:hypothetical protein